MAAKKPRLYEPEMRQATLLAISEWFAQEVEMGRAHYAKDKGPRQINADIPDDRVRDIDPLADRKKSNPNWYKTRVARDSGRRDDKGKPIFYTMPIMDALSAYGVQSRNSLTTREPFGRGMKTEGSKYDQDQAERVQFRADLMRRVHKAMALLAKEVFVYHACVTMFAQGHSLGYMASQLNCQKPKASEMLECGITWVMVWISVNPILREDWKRLEVQKPRKMRFTDLYCCQKE